MTISIQSVSQAQLAAAMHATRGVATSRIDSDGDTDNSTPASDAAEALQSANVAPTVSSGKGQVLDVRA